MTSSFLIPLITIVLVLLTSLVKRDREVDPAGNPTLRVWSVCLIGGALSLFFLWMTLKHLHDPFYIRNPERYIEASFCAFGMLVFGYSLFYKVTLTTTAIEVWYLPFLTRVYPIAGVEIKSMSKASAMVHFRNGQRLLVSRLYSGGPFFLENLRTLVSQRP